MPTTVDNIVSIQSKREEIQRRLDAELYRLIIARIDHLNLDNEPTVKDQNQENSTAR